MNRAWIRKKKRSIHNSFPYSYPHQLVFKYDDFFFTWILRTKALCKELQDLRKYGWMKYPRTIFNKIVLIGLVFLMAGLKGTGLGFFSIGDSHRVFVRELLGICNLGTSSSVYSTQHQECNYDWILILLPLYLLNNNLCYYRKPFFTANEVICQPGQLPLIPFCLQSWWATSGPR